VEAVGSAADDAELVVQPLGESVGQAMSDVGEDAIEVSPEGPGHTHEGLEPRATTMVR
jgi:hypothetical protein